jgi:hypothetical protein
LSDLGNYIYYILGPHGKLVQVPILGPMIGDRAETEYTIEGETLTPLGGDEGCSNKERRLGKLASVDGSATGDETMSNGESFADAVSYQSSDDNLFYIN